MEVPSDPIERLKALIGTWHTQGSTRGEAGGPVERIDATDTYEWLPGGAALLHTVDARVGESTVEGAEIIGFDPDRGHYDRDASVYAAGVMRGH